MSYNICLQLYNAFFIFYIQNYFDIMSKIMLCFSQIMTINWNE